jgi:hypothetical protein
VLIAVGCLSRNLESGSEESETADDRLSPHVTLQKVPVHDVCCYALHYLHIAASISVQPILGQ